MTKLRIGFMGTPDFAKAALQAICERSNHEVICVYSQPPRPKGRGQKTIPSPVHAYADDKNIPVFTPFNFKQQEDKDSFAAHELDVAVVAAYGLILPTAILNAPKYGCINIHGSLLPRWRGAAPIQRAIWEGDTQTGIGIMQMERGLDTGPVLLEKRCAINENTTAAILHDDLAAIGSDLIIECLNIIADKQALPPATPQDDSHSTYAHMLSKEDGRINWSQTAQQIDRQIRALNPWPGTWCGDGNQRFKIKNATLTNETSTAPAGTITDKTGLIACGNGTTLRITQIQPPGKKSMDFASALNGNYIKTGDQL